jgi:putative flippase GtrA
LSDEYDMNKDETRKVSRMSTTLADPAPPPTAIAAPAGGIWQRFVPRFLAGLIGEFLRFGVVGVVGFIVDTAVLYAGLALGLGPWVGRAFSYLAAASTTYALNRVWTFRDRGDPAQPARQWALFLVVNLVGFAANYGTYVALLTTVPLAAAHPVLGVAAGAIAGLGVNFTLSRRLVFRSVTHRQRSAAC